MSLYTADKKSFIKSLLTAFLLLLPMWIVWGMEQSLFSNWYQYGVYPRKIESWYGIFTMHFLHGSFEHIVNNTLSLLVLMTLCKWIYSDSFYKASFWMLVLTGLWTWLFARPSYHIGASGMVYAYTAFIFTSGFLSKNYRLMALSMLIIFLYGSLVWGVFPIQESISWEGHLMGALAGIVVAFMYRSSLPQKEKFHWEDEDENDEGLEIFIDEDDGNPYWKKSTISST